MKKQPWKSANSFAIIDGMKYAVVQSGGKQYKVAENDTVSVDKLGLQPNDRYAFEQVLLVVDGDQKQVGTPSVKGAVVSGVVLAEKKTQKVRVAKFKAKAKYRRVSGHRSIVTLVKIDTIAAGKEK